MPLSVLIIEDEFIIAEDIRSALLSNGYRVFGLARSVQQAMDVLKKGRPDFALVDITLGSDQSGLMLGKMFHDELKIPYIYVTSHSDSGTLEKVKLTHPTGFLLKPFKREAIYTAIEVAMLNFNKQQPGRGADKSVVLKRGEEKIRIFYSEILFLESDGNYTHVQGVTNRFTERKTLKELLDEMGDETFIRVHKSFAVNRSKVHHFSREKIFMAQYEIPVGRTYHDALKALS